MYLKTRKSWPSNLEGACVTVLTKRIASGLLSFGSFCEIACMERDECDSRQTKSGNRAGVG